MGRIILLISLILSLSSCSVEKSLNGNYKADGIELCINHDSVHIRDNLNEIDGESIYQLNVLNDSIMLWTDEIGYTDSIRYEIGFDIIKIRYAYDINKIYRFMRER